MGDVYLALKRGLEAVHTFVLCLLPVALGSDWVGLERSTVLCRDPFNAGRRFILFLLADCNPLAMLKPKADSQAEDGANAQD